MLYTSTRDSDVKVLASQAIVNGISKDGGLYVPSSFPKLSIEDLENYVGLSYKELSADILSKYLDFDREELLDFTTKAYSRFSVPEVCPLVGFSDGTYILELTKGPTLAFKDIALTLLPYLMTASMKKVGMKEKVMILVATSGDTGKAALEGFKDVEGTAITVLYPSEGVSAMQKLQMQTQEGKNVGVLGIKGNFDDAQSAVKRIFRDDKMINAFKEKGYALSSANSINWGRLVPQIVYYIYSYVTLVERGEIKLGDKINVTVPSGNFGNILAGYYARKMGCPIDKLICASNKNNVLCDFFETGVYDRNREFYKTMSPSMDILISSNLERLLYEISDCDSAFVKSKMDELQTTGKYSIPLDMLAKSGIVGGFADEEDTKMAIDCFFDINSYPLDTHTAVAMTVYNNYVAGSGDETPTVIVSTASPYKFPVDVYNAIAHEDVIDAYDASKKLQAISGYEIPTQITSLMSKKLIHTKVVEIGEIDEAVLALSEGYNG